MFVTGPLTAGSGGGGEHVRVRGAASRAYAAATGQPMNPTMPGYVADMTAPHGLAVRADLLDQGAGHSYAEMCAPLLAELATEERPADLLVLATEIPDIRFGRATATVLSSHCAGGPLAFTVCDQGLVSPFTALRLVADYARTGGCRRAVLLVAEQPTVYHDLPVPAPIPDRAVAVGIALETGGPTGAVSVRRRGGLATHQLSDALAEEMAQLRDIDESPTVLLGTHLAEATADRAVDGDVRACGKSQPLTGTWLELARILTEPREGARSVLLAEYDPATGQLCTATAGARPGGDARRIGWLSEKDVH